MDENQDVLYVILYLCLRQIPSTRKAQRQYALLPYLPYRKSQKPEVDSSSGNLKRHVHIMETSTVSAAGDILPYIKKRRKKTARKQKTQFSRKYFRKTEQKKRDAAGHPSASLLFSEAVPPKIQSAVRPAAMSPLPEISKAGSQVHRPGNQRDAPL